MKQPILKTLVRPVTHIDEADCVLNWETLDCPHCHGAGATIDDYPDSATFGEELDCYECDGSGLVALLKR